MILILGAIVFYTAGAIFTWQFFRTRETVPSHSEAPVAILVPVRGIDAGAWENWSSLCEQDYENYRVYFGVLDPADPAVPILEQIVEKYPDRASLTTDLPPRGPNHKDSNVSYLLEQIQTEWVIFTDSDIYVEPDYIRRVTAPLQQPGVGMVTCSYIARNPRYFGSALASLARCCDFVPSVLIARQLDGGVKLGIGVTMAVTQTALKQAGNLVFNRIGSDYNLGKRIDAAGYRVELSRYVLESDTGKESIADVFERELRWSRTIRFNKGPIYYTQIFCFGTVFCMPLLLLTGFASWAIGLTVITFLVRYLQAQNATMMMDAPRLSRWFWLLPLRDLLSFVIWAIGGYGRTIFWRGRKLRIQGDGIITE
ncbi:glycosyltransferase [Romeriopsis navalis]|uniref:glycosyltransferase n=1 Tax=Romeriopsis navalis TaxID=2992132 RepID=UPI0021F8B8C2|nr:glycosyltransferase [Romeriopsis navalis]